jgi:hypothetical protein
MASGVPAHSGVALFSGRNGTWTLQVSCLLSPSTREAWWVTGAAEVSLSSAPLCVPDGFAYH